MKKLLIIFGSILLFLIILNFALEPVAKHYANKALADLEGYNGHLQDVDIHLWRGAYRIDSLEILKVDEGVEEPFFATSAIDLSVEWKALFNGAIVGEVQFEHPQLNFIKRADTVETGGDNDFTKTLKDLLPITINLLAVRNGEIHYIDKTSSPPIDIEISDLQLTAENLSNVESDDEALPSSLDLTANTSGNGRIEAGMKMNAMKEIPDFDFDMELRDMELTYLNDFTEAYANFTFEEGIFYLSSELAMDNGKYTGYVKPIMENVRVVDLGAEDRSFWRQAWEVTVGATMEAFENQPKDRFATRVDIEGEIEGADVNIWSAIWNVLRNAFVEAFNKNVEQSVDISDANQRGEEQEEEDDGSGFLENVF